MIPEGILSVHRPGEEKDMSVIRITVEDELYQAMKEISRVKGISV
jgi:hypothetical protein